MRPSEAFAVVVRTVGLLTMLYGANFMAEAIVANIFASMAVTEMSHSFPFSMLEGTSGSLKTSFTKPVLGTGITMGILAVAVGALLVRRSSSMADFARTAESDSFQEI